MKRGFHGYHAKEENIRIKPESKVHPVSSSPAWFVGGERKGRGWGGEQRPHVPTPSPLPGQAGGKAGQAVVAHSGPEPEGQGLNAALGAGARAPCLTSLCPVSV